MSPSQTKYCPSCKAPFECNVGNITECQCYTVELSSEDQQYIAAEYSDCLCANCISAIRELNVLYDKIGDDYNATRKADTYLAERIYSLLSPDPTGTYMDIGCGTGNYLKALADMGLSFYGIDPSEKMLHEAKKKNTNAIFIKAYAEAIPITNSFFNGATAILTTHHWDDMLSGIREVHRVLKPGGKMVMFSFTPEQMRGYWLYHYFPLMIEKCMTLSPDLHTLEQQLYNGGFSSVQFEKYFVKDDLEDHFLYSSKHAPEMYLVEKIRNNASAFSLHAKPDEVRKGIAALEEDIRTGVIRSVIKDYENDLGDYLFAIATK